MKLDYEKANPPHEQMEEDSLDEGAIEGMLTSENFTQKLTIKDSNSEVFKFTDGAESNKGSQFNGA